MSSFFDEIRDQTERELGYTVKDIAGKLDPKAWKNRMTQDANNLLTSLRSSVRNDINSYIDDTLQDLRGLARKELTTPVDGLYGSVKSELETLAKNAIKQIPEFFGGVIDRASNSFKSVASGIVDVPGRKSAVARAVPSPRGFGVDLVAPSTQTIRDAVTGKVTSVLSPSMPNSVTRIFANNSLFPEGDVDPLYNGVDLSLYCKGILEDYGYITDKVKAKNITRKLCMINRPVTELDNPGACRSFAFFTRPNCNLVESEDGGVMRIVEELRNYPEHFAMVMSDIELYSELCRDNCGKSNLFHLLNNYVKEIPPVRLSETDREGVKNMYGMGIPVPGMPSAYNNTELSVTFSDNGRGDLSKLLYMLSMYKTLVGTEGYPMRADYIKYRAIDYLMSCYIVTVDANWEIIGFGVAIGLMISEPPSHFTKHNVEGFGKNELLEDFTVTFKCSSYYPHAPIYYDAFNMITGFEPSNMLDTRGSSGILYANGRELSTDPPDNANRTSVFDENSGGFSINVKGDNPDRVDPAVEKPLTADFKAADNAMQNNLLSVTKINGHTAFPDIFELGARAPGVYTAVNVKEPHRRRFCLGFSW